MPDTPHGLKTRLLLLKTHPVNFQRAAVLGHHAHYVWRKAFRALRFHFQFDCDFGSGRILQVKDDLFQNLPYFLVGPDGIQRRGQIARFSSLIMWAALG